MNGCRATLENSPPEVVQFATVNLHEQQQLSSYPPIAEACAARPWITPLLQQLQATYPDAYTHSLRVALLATKLAEREQLSADDQRRMTVAGLMHDVGKIALAPEIFSQETLSPEQRLVIQTHIRHSYELVKAHDETTAQIVVGHHESQRNPYPRAQQRADTPSLLHKQQKLLALADQVDSLLSDQAYREAWDPDSVFQYLTQHFTDPELIDYAIGVRSELST